MVRTATLMAMTFISAMLTNVALADDIQMDLQTLNHLRKGVKTDFSKVDAVSESMLKKYTDPIDKGKIYYAVAHIFAQAGGTRPAEVVQFATKALECPLDPSQRLRLYVYWGDALQLLGKEKVFMEKRKAAVVPYLNAFKELMKYDLPLKAPELPGVFAYDVNGDGPLVEVFKKKHMEAVLKREKAIFQGEMILHRDVIEGQIIGLYTRPPFATHQLQEFAYEIVGETKAVADLIARVTTEVAKLQQTLPKSVLLTAEGKPPDWREVPQANNLRFYVLIIISAVAILFLLNRYRRAK